MKKDFIKGITVGFVLAIGIGCIAAFAETYRTQIDAVYNDIKIVVNGKQITPKDVDGNTVDPFISNGTTYLPVRAISNALEQAVDWDGETNTVYIGGKNLSDEIDMSTLKAFKGESFKTGEDAVFTLRQEKVTPDNLLIPDSGMPCGSDKYYASMFILDEKYSKLTGKFAVIGGSDFGEKLIFKNADTDEILAEYENKDGDKAIDVEVNLLGVDKLSIIGSTRQEFSYKKRSYYSYLYNVFLTPIKNK